MKDEPRDWYDSLKFGIQQYVHRHMRGHIPRHHDCIVDSLSETNNRLHDRCAYVLLFYSVICYATLQTPYRCSSEAAETPLSRSIVSVIARLIKPFMLSR